MNTIQEKFVHWQEMEQIETIWELTKEWEGHWAEWKSGKSCI